MDKQIISLDLSDLDLSEIDTGSGLSMERITTGVGMKEMDASIGWTYCCTCCVGFWY